MLLSRLFNMPIRLLILQLLFNNLASMVKTLNPVSQQQTLELILNNPMLELSHTSPTLQLVLLKPQEDLLILLLKLRGTLNLVYRG